MAPKSSYSCTDFFVVVWASKLLHPYIGNSSVWLSGQFDIQQVSIAFFTTKLWHVYAAFLNAGKPSKIGD